MRKKLAVIAFAAAAFVGVSSPSWAVYTPVKTTTVTAGTFTGGAAIANYTMTIRDTANPFGAVQSSITWTGASPASGWKIADRLLLINSTVTVSGGGVSIYTDNNFASASPRFIDNTSGDRTNADSMAAGLVKGTSGSTSETPLPLAWSIKDSSKTVELNDAVRGIGAADPNNGAASGYNNKFQWLFMKDKYNNVDIPALNATAYVDGQPFVTMINTSGVHFGQDDGEFAITPDGTNAFVYLQANFTTAAAQQAYQTSTLRVEAFLP